MLLEFDQRGEVTPGKAGVGAAAGEMNWIVRGIAARAQFVDAIGRGIVDAQEPVIRAAQARMVEQGKIMEAKLSRDVAEQFPEAWQVLTGPHSLSEKVAEPPHRPRLAGIAFRARASTPPTFTERY